MGWVQRPAEGPDEIALKEKFQTQVADLMWVIFKACCPPIHHVPPPRAIPLCHRLVPSVHEQGTCPPLLQAMMPLPAMKLENLNTATVPGTAASDSDGFGMDNIKLTAGTTGFTTLSAGVNCAPASHSKPEAYHSNFHPRHVVTGPPPRA